MLYFLLSISCASSFPKYIFFGGVASFYVIAYGFPVTVFMMIEGQSTPERPIFMVYVPLSITIIYFWLISLSINLRRLTGLFGPPKIGVLSMISFKFYDFKNTKNKHHNKFEIKFISTNLKNIQTFFISYHTIIHISQILFL